MKLPKFLFINGPAGSGKSTLANLLCTTYPHCWRESFAEPIRDMIRTVFFPEYGPLWDSEGVPDLRDGEVKKQRLAMLAHLENDPDAYPATVRQAMIGFSEDYMKKLFGDNVFGQLLWHRCCEQSLWYNHFIIDDSGFAGEAAYVISKEGADACALIQLHRDGCNFSGDSRGYITLPKVKTIKIENNGAASEMLDVIQLEFGGL